MALERIKDIENAKQNIQARRDCHETAAACDFVAGDITRTNGELHITLLLPHGPDPIEKVAFLSDMLNVPDGPVDLP